MAYNLIFSNDFINELNKALDYISRNLDSPNSSKTLYNKISNTVSLIKENPTLFPLYHNDKFIKHGFRYTVISNYLLFYRINESNKTVELLHFIYGSRNITDMF